jgi:hypothetical protein
LHVGLIADNEATCGKLFEDTANTEGVLDEKFHSNEMEVHVKGKTYEHNFFEPIDQAYVESFETNYEECLAENRVKETD